MALTGRKRAFANAKLAGLSNKDAAIQAGYSEATASAAGSRNVKDPDVKAFIAEKRKAAEKAPKDAPPAPPDQDTDPMKFLEGVMTGLIVADQTQVRAAMAMLPFKYPKIGEGGKKDQQKDAAQKAGAGKFGLRAVK